MNLYRHGGHGKHRRAGAVLLTLGVVALLAPQVATASPVRSEHTAPQAEEHISVHRWSEPRDFARGDFRGTVRAERARSVRMLHPVGQQEYKDPFGGGARSWEYARWVSPSHEVGFGAAELIASWTADTPQGTWVQVDLRGTTSGGERTQWYTMGRWAARDVDIHRTSVPDQSGEHGTVVIDTFKAADNVTISSFQVRVTLYRKAGQEASPVLRSASVMASSLPKAEHVEPSPSGGAEGTVLDVPQYSQNTHAGHFKQYGGGGEAWCSPTSTAMVLAYYGEGPTDAQMGWIPDGHNDPQVDYAARGTYDYNYEGTGNWPFNVAYAGRFGLEGFVTRLHSLQELEQFIKAGIPVITSQSFTAEELPGAGYDTEGHLLVVVGFTEEGDVVVNDPASSSNADVRNVYQRDNFENVWQRTTSTGGISYIIHPPGKELPDVASLR